MKRYYKTLSILCAVVCACLTVFLAVSAHTAGKKSTGEVTRPSQDVGLALPKVISFTGDNGLRLYYIKDELPQLTLVLSVGWGKIYEKKDNAGISELLARTLMLAGSKKYPGEKLTAAIERVGGRVSIHESWENMLITIRVLERHADLAFAILADLVHSPNFEATYFNDARSLVEEKIRRRKDNPAELAFEMLRNIIFCGSGYGAVADEKSIRSISLNDLISLWRTQVKARNIMLGVASSLNYETVKHAVIEGLGTLDAGAGSVYIVNEGKILSAIGKNRNKIYFIPRPIPQATLVMGTLAPDIKDPRIYSLQVMDYILGGGSFSSRLKKEIRVKRGLAYAVQSVVRFRKKTGVFMAFAQTNNDQAHTTLSLMLDNISRMAREPVSADEMQWAKNALINSYIFEFETPVEVLGHYLDLAYYELPYSYLSGYTAHIRDVTGNAVLESSRQLFRHGVVSLVVGGNELKKNLSAMGEVVVLQP